MSNSQAELNEGLDDASLGFTQITFSAYQRQNISAEDVELGSPGDARFESQFTPNESPSALKKTLTHFKDQIEPIPLFLLQQTENHCLNVTRSLFNFASHAVQTRIKKNHLKYGDDGFNEKRKAVNQFDHFKSKLMNKIK